MYSSELHASYGNCHKLTGIMFFIHHRLCPLELLESLFLCNRHTLQYSPNYVPACAYYCTIQFVLQLHLAIGKYVVCGLKNGLQHAANLTLQGSNSIYQSTHFKTWQYTQVLRYLAAAAVWSKVCTCTDDVFVARFSRNRR